MPAVRRYPQDVMDRAVAMVLEVRQNDPNRTGVVGAVGDLLNVHPEVLRHWVKKAEACPGAPASTQVVEAVGDERVTSLEREVAELRRTNRVLKAAAILFASELEQGGPD